jgi:hypothetical protein
MRKTLILLACLFCSLPAVGQTPVAYEWLGGPCTSNPDKFSPRHSIRFNDSGWSYVNGYGPCMPPITSKIVTRGHNKLTNYGSPAYYFTVFDNMPYVDWGAAIDQAWDQAVADCNLQGNTSVYVILQPTVWSDGTSSCTATYPCVDETFLPGGPIWVVNYYVSLGTGNLIVAADTSGNVPTEQWYITNAFKNWICRGGTLPKPER